MNRRLLPLLVFSFVMLIAFSLLASAPTVVRGAEPMPQGTTTLETYLPLISNRFAPRLLFLDEFSNPNSGWLVGDNSRVQWSYQSGEYEILTRQRDWFGNMEAPFAAPADFRMQTEARRCTGCASGTVYGLVFGLTDPQHFYVFGINPATQSYALWKLVDANVRVYVQGWTQTSAIARDDGRNFMTVDRRGNTISLFVNNQLLTTVNDSTYRGRLGVGLYAESGLTVPVSARFDNFSIYSVGTPQTQSANSSTGQANPQFGEGPVLNR